MFLVAAFDELLDWLRLLRCEAVCHIDDGVVFILLIEDRVEEVFVGVGFFMLGGVHHRADREFFGKFTESVPLLESISLLSDKGRPLLFVDVGRDEIELRQLEVLQMLHLLLLLEELGATTVRKVFKLFQTVGGLLGLF